MNNSTEKVWVDPPSGWRYGFPKVWDREQNPDIKQWLLDNGVPDRDIEFSCNYLRMWACEEKAPASTNVAVEAALYQSGLTAQGCWDQLDDYAKTAVLKFAELVVVDCARLVKELADYGNLQTGEQLATEVRQYFGVEL